MKIEIPDNLVEAYMTTERAYQDAENAYLLVASDAAASVDSVKSANKEMMRTQDLHWDALERLQGALFHAATRDAFAKRRTP